MPIDLPSRPVTTVPIDIVTIVEVFMLEAMVAS
jgi:hypothetical protein